MGILSRLFSKRSWPPAPTSDYWYKSIGTGFSFAGKNVTEESALGVAAVYNAIYIISSTVGYLPLHLYKKTGEAKSKALDEQLYNMLHREPCPGTDAMRWREALMGHVLGWGNAYAEIERDLAYRPVALWIVPPNRVSIKKKKPRKKIDFISYFVRLDDGKEVEIQRENMLHIAGFGFNGITGYSPIQLAKESIGLSLAYEEYGARFFSGGALASGIIEYPGTMDDTAFDRFRTSIEEQTTGLSRSHRLLFLEEGLKFHQMSIAPDNAQFLESRKFQTSEIARWFNIPPHMIKDLERSTFSNIEHQGIEFVQYCLQPWLTRWEQSLSIQLLGSNSDLFFEFNVDGLLRGDIKSRWEAYGMAMDRGAFSINEVRAKENLPPIPGGDVHLVQLNMVPVDKIGEQQPDATGATGATDATGARSLPAPERREKEFAERDKLYDQFGPAIRQAADRIVQREAKALKSAVQKHYRSRSQADFLKWVDEFYRTMPELIQAQMLPVFTAYGLSAADLMNRESDSNMDQQKTRDFVQDYNNTFAERYVGSSRGQIEQIVNESDNPEDDLDQRADEWSEKRSDKIQENETRRLLNAVATTVLFAAGLGARWTIRGASTCPYCTMLSGSVIKDGGAFVRSGATLAPGGDHEPMRVKSTFKHPPLHKGCDCTITVG